jgi:thiamine-phosphate pyrophosphorylase
MCHDLPKKYHFISSFDRNLLDNFDDKIGIIYRNHQLKKYDPSEILNIKKILKTKKIKLFLSNNVKLAIKLDLDGVYISSFNKCFAHLSYSFKRKFNIIGSAHNLNQIRIKELQNVKLIFISSIFKKNQNFLGINRFKIISKYTKKKIIALGGLKKKNLKFLRLTFSYGFAGISYFE